MTLRGKESNGSTQKRAKEGKRKKGGKKSDENLGNSHFPASDEALFARGGVVGIAREGVENMRGSLHANRRALLIS